MSPFAPVSPPPDGLAAAFRSAGRRRARSAALTGSTSLLACAALAFALAGGGTQSLVQEPAPPADRVLETVPTPSRSTTPPRPVGGPAGLAAAPRDAPGQVSEAPRPVGIAPAARRPDPGTTPPARAQATALRPAGPVVREGPYYTAPARPACPVERGAQGERVLCSGAYVPPQDGSVVTLTGNICAAERSRARLAYDTAREVDLAVSDPSGREVWRWSTGQRFAAAPHALLLGVGECFSWSTTWDRLSRDGSRVPPGSYLLTVTFDAADLGSERQASLPFDLV